MQIMQWIVAAGTAIFVALVGFFQWRTAQQKAALDLFDVSKRLMAALGEFPPPSTAHSVTGRVRPAAPPPEAKAVEGPLPGGGGAEVYDALMDMTPELRSHLQGLIEEIKKNKEKRTARHPSTPA